MAKKYAESYGSYLQIPELLRLQRCLTSAHDELQFIVVHQVFELWFKLLLFELEAVRDAMHRSDVSHALHCIKRIHALVKTVTASFEVIETMRPYDFLEFRERLHPASGFQSLQFRSIEFLSGHKDRRYLRLFEGENLRAIERRAKEPTLWDAYVALLKRHKLKTATEADLVRSVIRILKRPDRHPLGALTEALIEYDELFSIWRGRHVRMTMRMIGARPGTGEKSVAKLVQQGYDQMGSGGVDYLKTTLEKVFFPLLWEARTFIQR